MVRKRKIALSLLIVTSILMFASIFSMNYKVLGLGLLVWLITVGYNLFLSTGRFDLALSKMSEYSEAKSRDFLKERKPVASAAYFVATPMIFVGLITLMLMLITLFLL